MIFILNLNGSNPKREFRGAWIATVKNIDWPSSPATSVEEQKKELIEILNVLHDIGINAVLFQVRSECDAFYDSRIEPWSYWLTGEQGKAPEPYYDPLAFIIEQAHKRGMELHAWFNPYRAVDDTFHYKPDSAHISLIHPEWTIQIGKFKFLNPGLNQVRNYTISVVMDVVRRYEIDGVHFDDYFYPYSGITDEDLTTFEKYPRGINNIKDWRRDNVNLFIRSVNDSIKSIKPHIKFGVSPFGIWKDGTPAGIVGMSSYHEIYCDATYWLKNHIVDYIAPQIYWEIGGPQDYKKLSSWWSSNAKDRHVYIGHALYKMLKEKNPWPANEIANQIKINRENFKIDGSIFFRTVDILNNVKGIKDTLDIHYYSHHALIPTMNWLDSIPPLFPFNLMAFSCGDGTYLRWQNPVPAIDGDKAKYIVVYRYKTDEEINLKNSKNIIDIISAMHSVYIDSSGVPGENYKYLVTALDKAQNESNISNIAEARFSEIIAYSGKLPTKTQLFDLDTISVFNNQRIKFSISQKERVKLTLFDQNGKVVSNFLEEEMLPGLYGAKLKLNEYKNSKYYYKLTTPAFSEMKSFTTSVRPQAKSRKP